jgi:TolA-binding protein
MPINQNTNKKKSFKDSILWDFGLSFGVAIFIFIGLSFFSNQDQVSSLLLGPTPEYKVPTTNQLTITNQPKVLGTSTSNILQTNFPYLVYTVIAIFFSSLSYLFYKTLKSNNSWSTTKKVLLTNLLTLLLLFGLSTLAYPDFYQPLTSKLASLTNNQQPEEEPTTTTTTEEVITTEVIEQQNQTNQLQGQIISCNVCQSDNQDLIERLEELETRVDTITTNTTTETITDPATLTIPDNSITTDHILNQTITQEDLSTSLLNLITENNQDEDNTNTLVLDDFEEGSLLFINEDNEVAEDNDNLFYDEDNERLAIGNNDPEESLDLDGRLYLHNTSTPSTTTNRLYSVNGNLYWNGTELGQAGDTLPSQTGHSGEILTTDGSTLSWTAAGGSGTVTSIAMTVPTGLSISGSPITTSGTLAVSLQSGYAIPTTTNISNWNTAYGWGDHSGEGYLTDLSTSSTDDLVEGSTNLYSRWDIALNDIYYDNGDVGIGLNSPQARLHVIGGNIYHTNLSSDPYFLIGDATTSGDWGGFQWDSSEDTLSFGTQTSGLNDLSIRENGYVGINNVDPDHRLDVDGNIGIIADGYLNFDATDGETGYGIRDNAGTIEYKNETESWVPLGDIGSDNPGGADTSVQFNDGGAFGGATGFTYTTATSLLTTPNLDVTTASTLGNVEIYGNVVEPYTGSLYLRNSGGSGIIIESATGDVGVGTNSPERQLHVNGPVRFVATTEPSSNVTLGDLYTNADGNLYFYNGSFWEDITNIGELNTQWTTTGDDIYYNDGNVGINDATPDHTLDVGGNLGLTTSSYINFGDTSGSLGYGLRASSGNVQYKDSGGDWTSLDAINSWAQSGSDLYYTAGNVGINDSSPTEGTLTVGGNIYTSGNYFLTDENYLGISGNERIAFDADGYIEFLGANVGIGVANPARLLTVGGAMRLNSTTEPSTPVQGDLYANASGNLYFYNGSGWDELTPATPGAHEWLVSADDLYYSTGNIGIGTGTPNNLLTLRDDDPILELYGGTLPTGVDGDSLGSIAWYGSTSIANDEEQQAYIEVIHDNADDDNADEASFHFYQRVANVETETLTLKGGNIGVGSTSPSTKLDVNGVITATSGTSTNWNTAYGWGDHSGEGYLTTVDVSSNTNLGTSGLLLDLTDDTLSINEGTMVNGKVCTYVSGTGLVCNSDEAATTFTGLSDTPSGYSGLGDYLIKVKTDETGLEFYEATGLSVYLAENKGLLPTAVDSSVSLLLHSDTTDGSTTFEDSSVFGHTASRFGDAQHDDAEQYFGATSIYLDGSGDYVTFPSTSGGPLDMESGDFTYELFFKRDGNLGTEQHIIGSSPLNTGYYREEIGLNTSNQVFFNIRGIGSATGSTVITDSDWHHLAISSDSGGTRLYLDGNLEATGGTGTMASPTYEFGIGGNYRSYLLSARFKGWVDEVRVTKGTAQYTGSTYTVPTSAFGDDPGVVDGQLAVTNDEHSNVYVYDSSAGGKWVVNYGNRYDSLADFPDDFYKYTAGAGTAIYNEDNDTWYESTGSAWVTRTDATGDFSNGGDTATADRTLGNTDNYDLGFLTNDTNRLHIQNDGNIGIGTTSPDALLHAEVSNANTNTVTYGQRLSHITSGTAAAGLGTGIEFEIEGADGTNNILSAIQAIQTDATTAAEEGALTFLTADIGDDDLIERMRIDKDGNVGIGINNPTKALEVYKNADAEHAIFVNNPNTGSSARSQVYMTNGDVETLASAAHDIGAAFFGTMTNHEVRFTVNDSSKVVIDTSGNLGLGTLDQFGSGEGIFSIANATTNPSTTLTNAAALYASGGELYAYDSAGNATQISPHNEEGLWYYYSHNTNNNKTLQVEMEKLTKDLDYLLGGGYVFENEQQLNISDNIFEQINNQITNLDVNSTDLQTALTLVKSDLQEDINKLQEDLTTLSDNLNQLIETDTQIIEQLLNHEERIIALEQQIIAQENPLDPPLENGETIELSEQLQIFSESLTFTTNEETLKPIFSLDGEMIVDKVKAEKVELGGEGVDGIVDAECGPENEGEMIYSKPEKGFYGCDGEEWKKLNN